MAALIMDREAPEDALPCPGLAIVLCQIDIDNGNLFHGHLFTI